MEPRRPTQETVRVTRDGGSAGTLHAEFSVVEVCCGAQVRERTVGGATTMEVRYFIGSKRAKARYYGQRLRGHWGSRTACIGSWT